MEGGAVSARTPFNYDLLSGPSLIRLLKRLKPEDDGILRFSLVPYDLDGDARQPYFCLSYTWGNPFAHGTPFRKRFDAVAPEYNEGYKVPILVNGQVLNIQKNLYDALSLIPETTYAEYANHPLDGTHGQVYLHIAAGRGRLSNIETWLRCGADINKLDDEGHNALHYAAGHGHANCILPLLRNGCLPCAKDINGATPIDLAREAGHDDVVALLDAYSQTQDSTQLEAQEVITPIQVSPYIWADAVCINQDDIEEKSGQVSIMDRIYSAANYVVAWLGPEDEHSQAGIRTLNTLYTHLKEFKESNIEPFGGKDEENYEEAGVPYIGPQEWDSLASLYQRQWSRRAWIVQEAILPRALLMYLGENIVSWRQLAQIAEAVSHLEAKLGTIMSLGFTPSQDVAVSVVSSMADVAKWRMFKSNAACEGHTADEYRKFFTLEYLVSNFWTFLASDLRDKIFAYYGLVNLFASERRNSNYRMSPAALYTITTRELIVSKGNLQILSSCVYPLLRHPELPSWVPDFGVPGLNAVPSQFSAAKDLEYVPPRLVEPTCNLLHLRGAFVGKLSAVGHRPGTGKTEKMTLDRSWLTMTLSLRGKGGYGEGATLSGILWTTLCMEMSSGSLFNSVLYGTKAPVQLGLQFRKFMQLLILAAADGMIRKKLGLHTTSELGLVFSHLDYDPMAEDMEPILADLDEFEEHDGSETCWLPSRIEVLEAWNDFKYNLVRNTEVESDNGPLDFHLPAGVREDNSRAVGREHVLVQSRLARKCHGFISAYTSMYGGRHLITLLGRYLGLASLATKENDQVWILPGLNAPAVLRPVAMESRNKDEGESEGPRFQFMGSCFINGMMDGELSDLLKNRLRDIVLV